MREVLIGQTDYTVLVKIAGTDGAPETGLTEASIDLAYSRVETDNDVTATDVAPAALSALTDAHTDWGFEEVDATNAPGLYRLDIADAVFASGAWEAVVTITDASGTDFYPVDIGFRLIGIDKTSAAWPVNAIQISGDSTAADTLELFVEALDQSTGQLDSGSLAAGTITATAIADGAIDRATFAADTGLQTIRSNTAQAGGAGTITLDASASATNGFYTGAIIYITGGTGVGQYGIIEDYDNTTKVATIHKAWKVAPDVTSTFAILPAGVADTHLIDGVAITSTGAITVGTYVGGTGAAALETTAQSILTDTAEIGAAGAGLTNINLPNQTMDIVGNITGNLSGSVGSVGTGGITAASIATDAIDADALAADGAVEIASAVWDRVLSAANHNIANSAGRRLRTLQDVGNYIGYVWIDTNGANTGSTFPEDGTFLNPVNTLARALTVAAAATQPIKEFAILSGSTITLASTFSGYDFTGENWTLALGGQDISNSRFNRAAAGVSGTATGTNPFFYECSIGTATIPPAAFQLCGFTSTLTLGSAGDYYLVDCFSQVSGTSTPVIDMGAAVGATNVSIRRWSGGLTINNIASGDVVSIDAISGGTITLNGADGNVQVRGMVNVVDNRTGSPTLGTTNNMDARFDSIDTTIAAILVDTGTTLQAELDGIQADTEDIQSRLPAALVNGRIDATIDATGLEAGALALINTEIDTALADINLDHLLKVAAVAGDVVDESVVARLASKSATPAFTSYNNTTDSLEAIRDRGDSAWTTGGGGGGTSPQLLQTTTIDALASQTVFTLTAGSADNDAYNGAILVVTDQSTSEQKAFGLVSDYVGATKTVTLDSALEFTIAVGDTVDILANAPAVFVSPVAGNSPDRIEQTTIKAFTGSDWSEPVSGVDENGTAINFSALGTLQFAVCDSRGTEVLQIDDASITTTSTTFTVTIPESVLTYGSVLFWSLRDLSDGDKVIMYGPVEVAYAAKAT